MRTTMMLTLLAAASLAACKWTEFDDLQNQTWVTSVQASCVWPTSVQASMPSAEISTRSARRAAGQRARATERTMELRSATAWAVSRNGQRSKA